MTVKLSNSIYVYERFEFVIQGYMVNDTQWSIASHCIPTGDENIQSLDLVFKPLSRGTIYGSLAIRTNLGVCHIYLKGKALRNEYRVSPMNQITMKYS